MASRDDCRVVHLGVLDRFAVSDQRGHAHSCGVTCIIAGAIELLKSCALTPMAFHVTTKPDQDIT
jgi:hypothetical protein